MPCDVTNPAQVTETVAATVKRSGKLDVLANVAGIGGFQRTSEMTLEEWNRMLAVNLTGQFLMCRPRSRTSSDDQGPS